MILFNMQQMKNGLKYYKKYIMDWNHIYSFFHNNCIAKSYLITRCKIERSQSFIHASFIETQIKSFCPNVETVEVNPLNGIVTLSFRKHHLDCIEKKLMQLKDRLNNSIKVERIV